MKLNSCTSASLVAFAAIGLLPISSNAQIVQRSAVVFGQPNLSRTQVDDQISEFIRAGYRQGFHVVADERGRMVDNGHSATFNIYLEAGVAYRFAGRCDSDCTDLDMSLEDSSGRELIADRDPDDTPGFNYLASRSGEYIVRLDLVNCNARRSHVGATVMAR
jgi:hypothetical protein